MNKFAFTILLLVTSLASFAQQFIYKLSISSNDANATKLYVGYEIGGNKLVDSVTLDQKNRMFSRTIDQPVAATLYTDVKKIRPVSVFLASTEIKVNIDSKGITVDNNKLQTDFSYLTENDRIRPKYFPLYGELTAKNDTAGLKRISILFDSLKKNDVAKSKQYFLANRNSELSLFAFSRFTSFYSDYAKVEEDFNKLPLWAKNSPDGKNIYAKIQGAKSVNIGSAAKSFKQRSSTGEEVSWDAFKGKYVLLDFWASWCGPCRKEHPKLIEAYEKFKDKNFEIISVSLDDRESVWLNAIAKDKITWTNLSDLKGQQNMIALMYGIQTIPANFLIGPDGIIIDKDVKGENLITRLESLLKN